MADFVIQDTVRGALKITGLMERECFNGWKDFLTRLPSLLSVEIPATAGSVIISSTEPNEDSRGKLWLRTNNSGGVIGLYLFQNGMWAPFYNLPPQQIIWAWGDSSNPPDGFVTILPGDEVVPAVVVTQIYTQYVPGGSGGFLYFAMRYVGI